MTSHLLTSVIGADNRRPIGKIVRDIQGLTNKLEIEVQTDILQAIREQQLRWHNGHLVAASRQEVS